VSDLSVAQRDLQQRYQSVLSFEGPYTQIKLESSRLLEELQWLKEQAGFFFLIDMSVLDFHQSELPHTTRFELFIWLLNMEVHERLCVSVNFELDDLPLPSIVTLFPGVEVLEREVFDMFGVTFINRRTQRLFNPPSFQGYPLRKDFVNHNDALSFEIPASQNSFEKLSLRDGMQKKTWFKLGPWNTMGQSILKIEYTLKQEKIDQCLVETGYYHRGIEKICEQSDYQALFSLLSKLNHCSAEFSSLLWAETCEKAANLSLPERAQALRMVI
jgi:NADH-quinone oxidoreductase subunit C/D